jgi:uncharacterized damage-inducible protein DinB
MTNLEFCSARRKAERLERLDEAAWERKVRFGAREDTLSQMVWGVLFDGIHHRGQLSTYLRPMGGKIRISLIAQE